MAKQFYTDKIVATDTTERHRWPWRLFFEYWEIRSGDTIYYERNLRGTRLAHWLCIQLLRLRRK